jgi:hypothetical protein
MIAKHLARLEDEQRRLAKQALTHPPETPTLFTYGRDVGVVQGLELAIRLLVEVEREDEQLERSMPNFSD